MKFFTNGADIIQPWSWCEKNSWHAEENSNKVVKSISRLKSDELYMQGVMIPGIEPLNNNKENSDNNDERSLIDTVLSMFDKHGKAMDNPLHEVQIIEDRLLKSVKCEENVTTLPYEEATKVIGHGLDYCTDSLNILHLSDRLTKVQKRFVPTETMNMMDGNLSKREETAIAASKKVVANSNDSAMEGVKNVAVAAVDSTGGGETASSGAGGGGNAGGGGGQKKESRASKTKRRLRTICEGTVTKYGEMSATHNCYLICVDQLFERCMAQCKELTSSKDLNSLMKQFAKSHVADVVKDVLEKETT